MQQSDKEEHRMLTSWAACCAFHVLQVFEKEIAGDDRPDKAIKAAKAWAEGNMKVGEARKFAFGAHAAARTSMSSAARAAARSAGHAAATAHVQRHAVYAAAYAIKASSDPVSEKKWQIDCLPPSLAHLFPGSTLTV